MLQTIIDKIIGTRPSPVKNAVRNLINEIRIARARRSARPQFEALRGKRRLKLHLGSGPAIKQGWVNIDLKFPPSGLPELSLGTMLIVHDLRLETLPLDDASCDLVYSSHFFEHLEYQEGVRLMRDCYRLLRAGGTFRAALPDFRRSFQAYVEGDYKHFDILDVLQLLPDVEPETLSIVDHINYGVYQYGQHKCIYDEEKISLVLRRIGFSSVQIAPYNADIDPTSELRRRYSFYVDALK